VPTDNILVVVASSEVREGRESVVTGDRRCGGLGGWPLRSRQSMGARVLPAMMGVQAPLWWYAAAGPQARFNWFGQLPTSSRLLMGRVYNLTPLPVGPGGRPAPTAPQPLSPVDTHRVLVRVAALHDHTTFLPLPPTPPFSWFLSKPSAVMAPPPGPGRVGAGAVKPPSPTHAVKEDIIDVDALPPVAAGSTAEDNGSSANVSRRSKGLTVEQPIDVDDPATVAKLTSACVGGPSDGGRLQPTRKFDGLLGEVLYEQQVEVKNEESEAARASAVAGGALGASVAGAGASVAPHAPSVRGTTLREAAVAARAEVQAGMVPPTVPTRPSWRPFIMTVTTSCRCLGLLGTHPVW